MPEPGEIPTDYAEDGVVFEPFPELEGPARPAVEAYVDFERGIRRVYRGADPESLLTESGAPDLAEGIASSARDAVRRGEEYRGLLRVSVDVERAAPRLVALELCLDQSELRLFQDGESGSVPGPTRASVQVIVSGVDGQWRVTEYGPLDGGC